MKPGIIAGYGIFLLISMLRNFINWKYNQNAIDGMYQSLDAVYHIVGFIIGFQLWLNFIMLLLQIKENRIRQQSVLPVPVCQIGLARIITPLALFLLFVLMLVLDNVNMPLYSLQFLYHKFGLIGLLTSGWFYKTAWWLAIVYGMWLFSESFGRALLITLLGMYMAIGVLAWVLPLYYPSLIPDNYPAFLTSNIYMIVNYTCAILAVFFVCVIFVSFMKRKSYLQ
jgi:hypothetical protein